MMKVSSNGLVSDTGNTEDYSLKLLLIIFACVSTIQLRMLYANGFRLYRAVLND